MDPVYSAETISMQDSRLEGEMHCLSCQCVTLGTLFLDSLASFLVAGLPKPLLTLLFRSCGVVLMEHK